MLLQFQEGDCDHSSEYLLFHEQASVTPSTSQDRQYRKNLDYIDLMEGWVLVYRLKKIA